MRHFFLIFSVCLTIIISCTTENSVIDSPESQLEIDQIQDSTPVDNPWSFETFQNEDLSWGYRILNESKLYINQPRIPAVQGNLGFTSLDRAETTAKFVIYKLESGFIPPSITIDELDSLKVIN